MTKIRVQVLGLLAGVSLFTSPAAAQSCAEDPGAVAPIAPTSNPKYLSYRGNTIALVGMSHEYLCHIPQPERVGQYCALGNYATSVFPDLQSKKNTVVRLWTVFNHSPKRDWQKNVLMLPPPWLPFTNEQPFKYVGGKWDLNVQDHADIGQTNLNPTYYTNLESVVHEAFCRGIIVEVTLLDPWCGDWDLGPFHQSNTTDGKGFSSERIFMSFENLTAKTDTSAPNVAARNAQRVAAAQVVRRLKRFPNVIFEVANEPDLIPSGMGITPTHTTDLQKTFVTLIQTYDNPAPSNHLIMINGHQSGAFAWNVPGAKVESAHYTSISDTRFGATELLRDAGLKPARANYAVSFNENKAIGLAGALDPITADDVRSEAWEFAFNEGALFDGYSVDRSHANTAAAVTQLGVLRKFLADPANLIPGNYIWILANMAQTSCNGAGNWCRNVPAWGAPNNICSPNQDGKTYWATMKSTTQHAIYLHHGALVTNPGSPNNPFQRYDARVCSAPSYTLSQFDFQVSQTGCWRMSWINPKDAAILSSSFFDATAGVWYRAAPAAFRHDIVGLLSLFRAGTCY